MRPHLRTPLALLASTLLLVFLASCGDDDDGPTNPSTSSGVLVLDVTPDTIDAPWSVVGPASYSTSGTGDTTLEDLEPGSYTVAWQAVDGWNMPSPAAETVDVPGGGTTTVTGTYTEIPDEPPAACMVVSPATGSVDTEFEFDASCSLDPSGPAGDLEYRWDWEADGTYDYPSSGAYTTNPVATHQFDEAGSKTVRVQVRDSTGNTDSVIESFEVTATPPAPVAFVAIPAGTFEMGSPPDEPGRDGDETQHTVTLTTAFAMQTTEVTNAQYAELAQWAVDNGHATAASSSSLRDALDGSTVELLDLDDSDCEISYIGGQFVVDAGKENHPVVEVLWYGAVAYCDWLSLREDLPRAYDHSTWTVRASTPYAAQGYRLPTEAEWEYACRAGTDTAFNNGTDCLSADTEANYAGDRPLSGCPSGIDRGETIEVASLPAGENDFGLYDMHGNVWEWCNDWYGSYGGDETDPVGESSVPFRVVRGGGWYYDALYCRSAGRYWVNPGGTNVGFGFRPVRSAF